MQGRTHTLGWYRSNDSPTHPVPGLYHQCWKSELFVILVMDSCTPASMVWAVIHWCCICTPVNNGRYNIPNTYRDPAIPPPNLIIWLVKCRAAHDPGRNSNDNRTPLVLGLDHYWKSDLLVRLAFYYFQGDVHGMGSVTLTALWLWQFTAENLRHASFRDPKIKSLFLNL